MITDSTESGIAPWRWAKPAAIAGWLIIAVIVGVITFHETSLFKSMPMNGAFQLYDPLSRLRTGQIPGKDFDFFHGTGTLLLHYPIFNWLGGDLHASELSRKLVSLAAFFLCFHTCARAWGIPSSLASLCSCAVFVVGEALLHGSSALDGASSLGVRSFLPAVTLAAAALSSRKFSLRNQPSAFHSFVGVGLGLSMFTSTEQGLAALGVHCGLLLVLPLFRITIAKRLFLSTVTGVIALAVYASCMFLVSGRHAGSSLHFLLAELPREQFWYFGAPPNIIPEFPSFFSNRLIILGVWLPLGLAALECLRFPAQFRKSRLIPFDSLMVLALMGMAIAAQVPQLAAYSHYHEVSTRNMGLVMMLWIWRIAVLPDVANHPWMTGMLKGRWTGAVLASGLLVVAMALATVSMRLAGKRAREDGNMTYDRMHLSQGWASDLSTWNELGAAGSRVAGTYKALIEDQQGSDFNGPDYIIHALGNRRHRFLDNLVREKPDFFLTLKPDFTAYEEWLQLRHWDVYRFLLSGYSPVKASQFHIFWKKDEATKLAASIPPISTTKEGNFLISAPNEGEPCVYTVTVRYSVTNRFAPVPFVGRLPRYLVSRDCVSATGTVFRIAASLPPDETSWEFPIVLGHGEQARFALTLAMPLPGSAAAIESIDLTEMSRDPATIDALTGGGHLPVPSGK